MLKFIVGLGLDVGAGEDGLDKHSYLFPRCKGVRPWDVADGDGQTLDGVSANEFDFLHSSHSLEHMVDPIAALRRWVQVVKPKGHLIITVPDEELYEQGIWPSTWNPDHKSSFRVGHIRSPGFKKSVHVLDDLCDAVRGDADLIRLTRLEETFSSYGPRRDQTQGVAECAIELVLRKR